jgi:hypothetical protein
MLLVSWDMFSTLKMEAERSSETSMKLVPDYTPSHPTLHSHRCDNFKYKLTLKERMWHFCASVCDSETGFAYSCQVWQINIGECCRCFMLKSLCRDVTFRNEPCENIQKQAFLRYWKLLRVELTRLPCYCCKCLNSLSYKTEGSDHITCCWYTRCSLLLWSKEHVSCFNAHVTSCRFWRNCENILTSSFQSYELI